MFNNEFNRSVLNIGKWIKHRILNVTNELVNSIFIKYIYIYIYIYIYTHTHTHTSGLFGLKELNDVAQKKPFI